MRKFLFLLIILVNIACNSDRQGSKAFIDAVWSEDKRAILKEINNGANPNAVDEDGYPLFCTLVDNCDKESIEIFLEKGADINCDCDEESALDLSFYCDDLDFVKFLVENGADVNYNGGLGMPTLSWAIFVSNKETIEYLLEQGASKDIKDEEGYLPIAYAASVKRLKELEELGFSTDVVMDNGMTLLMSAVESNYRAIVEYLIVEKKMDTTAKTKDGKTIWDFLDEEKHPDMKALLERVIN